ncbi:MAG TPA: hypothetical protein VMR45_05100 [Patescibacteria group bacterium]|nr:hypothetical protein [Patescibacteria group bacterium]
MAVNMQQEGIYTVNLDGTGEQLVVPGGNDPSWQSTAADTTPTPATPADQTTTPAPVNTSDASGVLAASTVSVPKAPNTGFAPASASTLGFTIPVIAIMLVVSLLALRFRSGQHSRSI